MVESQYVILGQSLLFLLLSAAYHLLGKLCSSVHCSNARDSAGTDSSVVGTEHGGQQMSKGTCMANDGETDCTWVFALKCVAIVAPPLYIEHTQNSEIDCSTGHQIFSRGYLCGHPIRILMCGLVGVLQKHMKSPRNITVVTGTKICCMIVEHVSFVPLFCEISGLSNTNSIHVVNISSTLLFSMIQGTMTPLMY